MKKINLLSVRVLQYPEWKKKKCANENGKKNPNQQTRNLHQILNVYSTEQSLIFHIYPLANLNISCDLVLAGVLDKSDSM